MRDAGTVIGQPATPAFVGRDAELATIDDLLASTCNGRAGVLLVAGEAGIGKSRLVGELRGRASAAGAVVATGRVPVGGVGLPYCALVGLLRDLARRVTPHVQAALVEPVQRLLLGSSSAASAAIARLELLEALLRCVEGVGADRPATLVIEDLHWADLGSVEAVDFLARNVDDHSVLLAATYRPDEIDRNDPVRRVLNELRRLPSVIALELAGLSREEIAALVADVAGGTQSWAVVDAIHRRSDGNPLFAEELVPVRDASELPTSLRRLLAAHIEHLTPDARTVVMAAAVLGAACDHRLLGVVSGLDAERFDVALADVVGNGVLVADGSAGVVRFRHALLGEAAGAELLPTERTRIHRRAADALQAGLSLAAAGPGHAAAQLAEHRFGAGDWAGACEASISAAEGSQSLYALHAAHAHLRRALEAHPLAEGGCSHPAVDEAELYRLAADTAALVGENIEAFALARAAVQALDATAALSRHVAISLLLARCALNAGCHDDAVAAVAAAEARLDQSYGGAGSAEAAEVAATHAWLLMRTGHLKEATARCATALELARLAGARVTEGQVLATLGPCLAEASENDRALVTMWEAVAVAEEVGDPDLLIRAYNNLTHVQIATGRLSEAAELAADTMRDTSPLGLLRLGGTGFNGSEALVTLGRWAEAERLCALLDGKARASCSTDTLNLALLALRRGDLAAAEVELDRRMPTDPQSIAQHENLRAEIALERDQPDDAAAAVDRALSVITGNDLITEHLTAHMLGLRAIADRASQPTRPGRRTAADPTKNVRLADAMLAEVETLLAARAAHPTPSPWVQAISAQARAEASRVRASDPSSWATAAREWEVLDAPFHIGYCQLREAEARLVDRNDRRRATTLLQTCWQSAQRLGAGTLIAACRRLADRAHITLEEPDNETPKRRAAADLGLTSREVEVLELLARGYTDGQIASELFISKKTASVHVSNILTKLDATDRRHAGTIGRETGLGPTT